MLTSSYRLITYHIQTQRLMGSLQVTLLNSHLINTIVNDEVDEDECLSQIPDLLKKDCFVVFL